jgi:phosphoglycolate phosphatase
MMTIKAILFDKDGTLIDVNRTWIPLYRDMLMAEFGDTEPRAFERLALAGYDQQSDSFRAGSVLAGGTTKQMVAIWWPHATAQAQNDIAYRIDQQYAPLARKYLSQLFEIAPLMDELHAMGFVLGVGTNDSVVSAHGQMQALGVVDRFAAIIGYDSVSIPKPSGEMIQHFAGLVGCRPDEIAMVGDNTHDLEEARHGGAGLAIGVLSGNGTMADLAPLADHVLVNALALPGLLHGM